MDLQGLVRVKKTRLTVTNCGTIPLAAEPYGVKGFDTATELSIDVSFITI
jgi:hypothetical protein